MLKKSTVHPTPTLPSHPLAPSHRPRLQPVHLHVTPIPLVTALNRTCPVLVAPTPYMPDPDLGGVDESFALDPRDVELVPHSSPTLVPLSGPILVPLESPTLVPL